MIEQRARFHAGAGPVGVRRRPRRRRAPTSFGPGLPGIREWTSENFDFAGYVTGFDPSRDGERAGLRARLGRRSRRALCVVTVGGSGVGGRAAAPGPRRRAAGPPRHAPDLRFVVVAGPRIDPRSLPRRRGVSVPRLRARPAPAPGGVRRRRRPGRPDDLHGAHGRRGARSSTCRCGTTSSRTSTSATGSSGTAPAGAWTYDDAADPDALAERARRRARPDVDWRPVETDGAARAAALLADLL